MQRVDTLIKKLQEQFAANVPASQLLLTAQMLQAELSHIQANALPEAKTGISVNITQNNMPAITGPAAEKTIEVLQVDEAAIEAELEEIKRHAEAMKKLNVQNKPAVVYQTGEDDIIPTLAHYIPAEKQQKEINEIITGIGASLNDKLKQTKIDLGHTLTEAPIKDLKKAIGINDRFLYINELFRGDESMYERSIKTINSFSILPEAEYWIQRELKIKIGWNQDSETVKQFDHLVKRRFA
jgi:hypothetical protein